VRKVPVDLIMFDFDGTLADSLPAAVKAIQLMLAELGYPRKNGEEIGRHIGFGERALVAGSIGSEEKEKVDQAQASYYRHNSEQIKLVELYPHVRETLEHFRDKKMVVVSNKRDEFIIKILEAQGVHSYFKEVFGGDSSPCLKPDPCVLLSILKEYGVRPERALLVGDMKIDIDTGKNAGVITCGAAYGFEGRDKLAAEKPDFIIGDIEELRTYIE